MANIGNSRKPWVGGNWKCNGSISSNADIVQNLNKTVIHNSDVAVFPTFLHIDKVANSCNKNWSVGAQNCSVTDNGAFTGEVSTKMLKEMGIQYVLCGHSERRQLFSENSELVASKVEKVLSSDMKAVVCIGETLDQRNAGMTMKVCEEQIKAVMDKVSSFENVVIAYEPIWAIGTGVVASPETAEEVHKAVRKYFALNTSEMVANSIRIVYGGSVNAANSESLISQPNIDGFLVGGASLKPEFATIINNVEKFCQSHK
uniref:Triosephosphate isomerase n=1 Tax=Nephromyces sp. MMRI TaxID=2496275 RepID=A0A3Q8UBK4_9APIC|nr:triosephosphate isomerase [Nephromyces sp. MMRI]